MNVPILIHKGIGKGSSQNLGIEKLNNSEASCLCARDYKGISRMRANATIVGRAEDIEDYIKTKNVGVSRGLRIRKLTPKECWRLQGWCLRRNDGTWDDSLFEKAKAVGVSDSQLYKQAGNGCSANITYAIGLALKERVEKNE